MLVYLVVAVFAYSQEEGRIIQTLSPSPSAMVDLIWFLCIANLTFLVLGKMLLPQFRISCILDTPLLGDGIKP